MEAIAVEALSVITEMAVEELVIAIAATKCCAKSKKKWDKVIKKLKHHKEDREERVLKRVNSLSTEVKTHLVGTLVKITSL